MKFKPGALGRGYEEVEIAMCGEFFTVIPCPHLEHPDLTLEPGEIFAVLKPLANKQSPTEEKP